MNEKSLKEGKMKRNILFQIIAFSIIFLTACSGGGDGGAPSTGTVSVALTDATTTDFKAIYITIEEVAVHKDGGGWKVISTPSKTYNLLELVNGVREELGLATLATGHYTQMRLVLKNKPDDSLNVLSQKHLYGNYFIDTNDNIVELKVPSGYQTGIKIVKGFDINANETTELVLDFDATRSIVMAGSSGTWLLKPTIKVMETKDYCIISGKAGEEGVLISAQIYNGSSSTEEGKVQIEAATVSDENGNYKLFVAPGTYTLVGYKDGRTTFVKSTKVVTAAGSTYTENFTLSSSLMGTLAGGPITILDASLGLEQYSTFSIRQDKTVSGNAEQIEVKSFNVANGGLFIVADNTAVPLPVGDYEAIISTFDYLTGSGRKEIKEAPITIGAAATTDIGPITY
jgi:hypothetical protein